MEWYASPFLDEAVCRDYRHIKRKIKKKKKHPPVYLLVLPDSSSRNLLEILPSLVLLQKNYPTDGLLVIGMAHSREKALKMTEELFGTVYAEGFGTDLRGYMNLS